MDRPGEDPVDNDHSTDSAVFDVLQHRRQAVVPAVRAAGVRARLPQLPERTLSDVHQVHRRATLSV